MRISGTVAILHASAEDGHLLFWAECDVPPYTLPAPALEKLLRPWASETLRGLAWERVAWLPTVEGRIVPSTPRLGETPDGEIALQPHRVAAIPFDLDEALRVLQSLPEEPDAPLAAGIWSGESLRFWAALERLARALVVRGQVVPTVVRGDDGDWEARWLPAAIGEDATRLSALARALPGAARALVPSESSVPASAYDAVSQVLQRLTDRAIRPPKGSGPRKLRAFESPHHALVFALGSRDGKLGISDGEGERLARETASWSGPLRRVHAAPLRLCFRLEEAESESAPWRVTYLVQSVADPSLLVEAKEIWAGKKTPLPAPQEFLLPALGEAARLSPEVAESLKKKHPGGFALPLSQVFLFLSETAPLLESAGFVTMLPAWWAGKRPRLASSATVRPKLKASGGLTLETLVAFDASLTLDGEPLTEEERVALVRAKTALVRVRGKWVQLDAEGLARAKGLWEKAAQKNLTVRDVIRLTLGADDAPGGGIPLDGVRGEGALGTLLERLTGERPLEPVPTPEGFHGTLRPYQERGFWWLKFLTELGLGACLADDMGLGKTAQTIALLLTGERPCLLVCPTSVVGNWERELARFAPSLRVLTQHGPGRLKGDALTEALNDVDVVLTSYALLHRDSEALTAIRFAGAILDEAQNVKNPETRQSRAARALDSGWKLALTGTPVENHVGDLWALFAFLNPGLLGSERHFKQKFFVPIQQERDALAAEALKKRVGPLILRRLKTDKSVIADLPDKVEQEESCPLTPEQATLYEAVVRELTEGLEGAEGMARRGLVLATLTRLKQVCNHPAHFLADGSPLPQRSGKLARLEELIEALLDAGESALIFTQFAELGERLAAHLRQTFGRETLFLSGKTTKKQRDALVERFQTEGGPPLFVLSLKAGGVGLNLTRASRVIHFDRWWNPAVEDQATDRAFRIGQRRNVFVHKFVCRGTVEERIAGMIAEKREIAGKVVGTGEGWLTELSTAALTELFALSRERALEDD